MIELPALIANSDDTDFLKELIGDAAADGYKCERRLRCFPWRTCTAAREPAQWLSRAGLGFAAHTIDLQIPKLRKGN